MSGIYIHIPFCKKACHYCNFHFSTQTKYIDEFTEALLLEIELQQKYLNGKIETLYFGGGTPSLLSKEAIQSIYTKLKDNFDFAQELEFTLEANPDDLSLEKAEDWLSIGINRLSIGIQSFQPQSLAWMNRAHSTTQAHQSIQNAKAAGFSNISADLIYGTPHLTDQDLRADLEILLNYEIPHISCYALTVEEKTALHTMIQKKTMEAVDTSQQARQFNLIVNSLDHAGWEHYEISNFSKPNQRSKHNSNYWNGVPYLGLGPAAHSYNVHSRQWNLANNQLYFQSIKNKTVPAEIEALQIPTQFNEYMMIALRKMEGFSFEKIKNEFGAVYENHAKTIAVQFAKEGKLIATPDGYTLSKEAKFFADGIASDFFWLAN
ncbi:MAG: radical SAM family heme chaperone HemW [Bacteroidetes bacterium]|nr:radical SAM family heme chaperone HemW [Bacteroidota bacterium]